MITRLLDRLHRLRHGHEPVWDSYGYDGISPLWTCRSCHPDWFIKLRDLP